MATAIPVESKPGYYATTDVGKKVTGNIAVPAVPTSAKQTYTTQTLDPAELLTTATMGAPTTVGARTITKPTLGAATGYWLYSRCCSNSYW